METLQWGLWHGRANQCMRRAQWGPLAPQARLALRPLLRGLCRAAQGLPKAVVGVRPSLLLVPVTLDHGRGLGLGAPQARSQPGPFAYSPVGTEAVLLGVQSLSPTPCLSPETP